MGNTDMDILLAHGYFLGEDPHEWEVMKPYPPLGMLYVSSHLKARGFDVGVFDGTFEDASAFQSLVEGAQPGVVGLYANLITRGNVVQMARFCQDRGCVVVVGGPEPANYPEEYLARGADVVVIGEAEGTLEELLQHLARRGPYDMRHIQGLIYRDPDAMVRTDPRPLIADLDVQPFPDRGAVDVERYLRTWREHHKEGSVSLITSRGCPYRCAWCSHAVFGHSYRRRSPRNVADEVDTVVGTYAPDILWYADDVFAIDQGWLATFAGELEQRKLRVPFETTCRVDHLNEKVVGTLADMGCLRLWIGVESGSQPVLDAMERRIDVRRVPEVVRLVQRHGIETGVFIMLGYEGEELADLEATVRMLEVAKPDHLMTTVAYPVKGTPYYERVRGRIAPLESWEAGSDRDLAIAGRPSDRYYGFATRWMVNRVTWSRCRQGGEWAYPQALKACLNAQIGRVGMRLTGREVSHGS